MNKRIRELNHRALAEVMNGKDPDKDIDKMYIPKQFTKKFAELIVREAMDYASRNWEHGHLLAQDLKTHFGVEE
jgi:hypothetical protein